LRNLNTNSPKKPFLGDTSCEEVPRGENPKTAKGKGIKRRVKGQERPWRTNPGNPLKEIGELRVKGDLPIKRPLWGNWTFPNLRKEMRM